MQNNYVCTPFVKFIISVAELLCSLQWMTHPESRWSSSTMHLTCGILLTSSHSLHISLVLYSGLFQQLSVACVSMHLELYSHLITCYFSSAFCTCLLFIHSWVQSLSWLVKWW